MVGYKRKMPEEREIEKQLKLVSKTGKFVVGRREVMSGLKGSKLLVWSASASLPQALLDESKNLFIPAVRFNGNPVELGRACGIPFRVSVISVKAPGDADIKAFATSADYVSSTSSASVAEANPEETKKESETPEKPAKTKKRKSAEPKDGAPSKSTGKKKSSKKEEEEALKTKPKKTKQSTKAKDDSES